MHRAPPSMSFRALSFLAVLSLAACGGSSNQIPGTKIERTSANEALVEVVARARADARALRQAKAELERANRALERERQREQQQNELKTRFVSATSHEFRTPLTTILSSSQMLATYGERWDAERRMTHFERITTAAHHMTEMLEEILLIGRAEMGVLAAHPVEIDLRDFCKSLIETLSRAAGRQGSPRAAAALAPGASFEHYHAVATSQVF